ncbi:MAG: tRNA lysidine(34) synthetase TilS [Saccharospirillaceae bacterium]|nr:tRNA lysidine(34) synthetase TilS [Pseudomonadales bacterium]NRB81798.1 tRNA lysidine(34) synthetase TilS [Saccharospirillaceae bacterium]
MLLTNILNKLKQSDRPIFLGFSGGVDSQFLFDQLIQNHIPFKAIHIHHGLQKEADNWLTHCQDQCKRNNIILLNKQVNVVNNGKGIEDSARNARIEFFRQCLDQTSTKGILLLAHHQDDQIETFFLRLMRGAALNGLSAMHSQAEFYGHEVIRPLIEMSKSKIIKNSMDLTWIEDPSNNESKYDRNFLRNELLPLLSARWAQYRHNIQQSISHIQNAKIQQTDNFSSILSCYADTQQLLIPLNTTELSDLIYQWLLTNTQIKPTKNLVNELVKLTQAKQIQRAKVLHLDQHFIFDGYILHIQNNKTIKETPINSISLNQTYTWYDSTIHFKQSKQLKNNGLKSDLDLTKLSIDHRPNNQKLSIFSRDKRRDLKRLLQELDLSWQAKKTLPFIFYEHKLIAIGQYFIVNEFAAAKGSGGIEIICK